LVVAQGPISLRTPAAAIFYDCFYYSIGEIVLAFSLYFLHNIICVISDLDSEFKQDGKLEDPSPI